MTKLSEVYVCELCGNTVEVIATGGGDLVCCSQEMTLQKENTTDASKEKHVPVVQKSGNTVTVNVGSAPHPMDANHHIAWIELIEGSTITRCVLKPGDAPTATFTTNGSAFKVRAFCNLHGLWTS
ncbi:MAG: desulfoferrodoxin [Thermoguttaceae bacterium]